MKVNRVKDFVERVVWAAIIAGVAATGATEAGDWRLSLKIFGLAALFGAVKVIAAQQIGTHGSGDAIPGGVIEGPQAP